MTRAWLLAALALAPGTVLAQDWSVMLHGRAFLQYVRQFGTRGDYQLGSTNWAMAVLERSVGGGSLGLRVMLSAEPFTLTGRGYPQLLQVAHPYRGTPLPDRQHPHELFSEIAVAYERQTTRDLAISLYAAPVGEPALGPVFYRHRPAAAVLPLAPLGHNVQDYTHVSFGVLTLGAFTHRLRVEASVFNGAHPDDRRTDFDYQGARLNSYAVRLSARPGPWWSIAGWVAHLAASGGSHQHGELTRFGVALQRVTPRGSPGGDAWATTLVYSADVPAGSSGPQNTLLLETLFPLDPVHSLAARAEYVRRTDAELGLTGSIPPEVDIGTVSLGFARRLVSWIRLGAVATVSFVPQNLELFYGSRTPAGVVVYLGVEPAQGNPNAPAHTRVSH
jgi:hypothetical protein